MPDEADLFPLRERIAADIARRAAIVAGAQDWREAAALLHQAGELTTSTARALGVVPLVEARLGAEMKAAVEAKNECELVVLLAEARIGAELQAAQDRGEVAAREDNLRRGPKSEARTSEKATLPDIGIPRQRAAEMKKLAEARN